MSRAFVDEDASASNEAEAPELKIPIPPGSRNYLTPEGAAALSHELHELTGRERPRILAELTSRASSTGTSDPDEIGRLRRNLGEVDRRIAYLYTMSSLAEVVNPPPPESRDRVKFGAWVRVEDESGREFEYRIVGVDEADPARGLIGWASPVARSLMGRQVGERISVDLPTLRRDFKIISLDYRQAKED